MSMISKPQLKPKAGYTEQVDCNGNHYYAPTIDTTEKGQLIAENAVLKAQLQAQSDRADFIEDCLAEMASALYG